MPFLAATYVSSRPSRSLRGHLRLFAAIQVSDRPGSLLTVLSHRKIQPFEYPTRDARIQRTMKKWTPALIALYAVGCGAAYHGPPDDHFDGNTFVQPPEIAARGVGSLLKWVTHRDQAQWPNWVDIPEASVPPARSEKPRVQFVNHATVLVQIDGLNILTDPVYSERVSFVSFAGPARHKAPGIPFEKLPPIDLVLISHNHYDHLNVETLQRLQARDHSTILVGLGNQAYLKALDVDAIDTDWWQTRNFKGVGITFTPVQHWSARGIFDGGKSLWGGYFIKGRAGSVYFGGDTGYGPHFVETRKKLGSPDLALLPIGAYEPRWFMSAHHMNPEDAVAAHLDLGAKQSLGIHWGTFQLTDEGINAPVLDLAVALKKYDVPPEAFQALENGGVLK